MLFKSSTVTNFCHFVILLVCEGNTLNSPIMKVDLSTFPCNSVGFCFRCLKAMLLDQYDIKNFHTFIFSWELSP